jgi:cell division transport system permease protein
MIIFYFSEAFRSVLKAKASFTLTVLSLAIGVLLCLCSAAANQSSDYLEKRLKEIFKVNLFLKESFSEKELAGTEQQLRSITYVSDLSYISKEDAAELFIKETGEDFKEILDYNPLPASFVIILDEKYTHADSLKKITDDLLKLEFTEEVVYRNQFVYRILNIINSIKIYLFLLTAFVILIALYLVFTTINFIINSRRTELETMKLIGAKLSAIKIPVLLNGVMAGVLASIFCIIVYYFVTNYFLYVDAFRQMLSEYRVSHYLILAFTGPAAGIIMTYLALKKITLKI